MQIGAFLHEDHYLAYRKIVRTILRSSRKCSSLNLEHAKLGREGPEAGVHRQPSGSADGELVFNSRRRGDPDGVAGSAGCNVSRVVVLSDSAAETEPSCTW